MERVLRHLPNTLDDIFLDFKGRRKGLIKALTTDTAELYRQCDPEKRELSLYGHPDETWEVKPPSNELPTVMPEPVLGVNYSREETGLRKWLSEVAKFSDSWLLSVAYFFGRHLTQAERTSLFDMINDLPTLAEIVVEENKKRIRQSKSKKIQAAGVLVRNEELCGECELGDDEDTDGFWIFCDICETWFHGNCVKITPAQAEHIDQYKCPSCVFNNTKKRLPKKSL